MKQLTEQENKELTSLCKIEIRRWKFAAEAVPEKRYMVELMEIALAALQAEPVANFILIDGEYQQLAAEFSESPDAIPLYTTPPATPPAPSAPDGWQLVPVEPDWNMLSADGCKEHHEGKQCSHHDNRKRIWRAMLAAAPAPGGKNESD